MVPPHLRERISVIVPVYDVEAYLPECIDSIRGQTYPDLEIILVDDGSPDRCGEICDEAARADPRIRVLHKANGGVSDARNAGMEAVTAPYLTFVDSDDFLPPDCLEILYRALTESGADVAVGSPRSVPEDARPDGLPACGDGPPACAVMGRDAAVEMALVRITNHLWGRLYRSRLWEGIRFPEGKIYEDAAVIFDVLSRARSVAFLDAALYAYRCRRGSITNSRFRPDQYDYVECTEAAMARLSLQRPDLADLLAARRIRACFNVYEQILRSGGMDRWRGLLSELDGRIRADADTVLASRRVPAYVKIKVLCYRAGRPVYRAMLLAMGLVLRSGGLMSRILGIPSKIFG